MVRSGAPGTPPSGGFLLAPPPSPPPNRSPSARAARMSVRQTTEIASEASRFSLRSMFPVSISAPARAEPEPGYAQEPLLRSGAGQGLGSLSPNTGGDVAASVPEGGGGIKFSLPRMTSSAPPAPVRAPAPFLRTPLGPGGTGANTTAAQSARAFSRAVEAAEAGGDCTMRAVGAPAPTPAPMPTVATGAADAELARLRVAMADLQERLRVSQVRLTTTEASVSRGNTALKTERAQYKQALTSLTSETAALRQREAETKASLDRLQQRQAAFAAVETKAALAEALRVEVETVSAKHDDVAGKLASAQRTNAALTERIGAAQQELLALTDEKASQVAELHTKLALAQCTAASAEKQIDDLDERLFRVRSGAEAAATGACATEKTDCSCKDKVPAPDAASEYGSEYGSQYETETDDEPAAEPPAEPPAEPVATGAPCCANEEVLERAAHAVDAIFEGCCAGEAEGQHAALDALDALEAPEAPEATEATEAPIRLAGPVVVALSCCPDACGETARAHVPHVEARHALAMAMSAAPLHMGLAVEENGGFHAHAHEATSANSEAPAVVADTAEGLAPGAHPAPTATSAAVRTSAYVTAVSSDIKKQIVAHQALWTATRSGPV